ncbi:MAG TPA: class I SAM-dependent methyltransferase [Candidatus Acidoferrum sp.]|nr:class I SAM-dependent methyltransferase [Candidatus Acidoferrum sp.]
MTAADRPGPDPLFATQRATILDIWDEMQRLQSDFGLAHELPLYYRSPQWHAAKMVLDLGTGNGYYLRQLAARFPDKIYRGVDVSAELIARAERHAIPGPVSFAQRSLFDTRERYNFVLMRLLLQHLEDIPAVLDHVAELLHPGESALIIDADDRARYFHPDLPEFTEFFAAYTEHERRAGRDRNVLGRVEAALGASTAWRLGAAQAVVIPSTIPGNLERFARTYTLLVDLVEQGGGLHYDFSAVKRAWRQWARRSEAYTQVGLNLIRLDRL